MKQANLDWKRILIVLLLAMLRLIAGSDAYAGGPRLDCWIELLHLLGKREAHYPNSAARRGERDQSIDPSHREPLSRHTPSHRRRWPSHGRPCRHFLWDVGRMDARLP